MSAQAVTADGAAPAAAPASAGTGRTPFLSIAEQQARAAEKARQAKIKKKQKALQAAQQKKQDAVRAAAAAAADSCSALRHSLLASPF